jgi:hypothetical protein
MSAAFVRGSGILSFDSAEVSGETDHEAISQLPPETLECITSLFGITNVFTAEGAAGAEISRRFRPCPRHSFADPGS